MRCDSSFYGAAIVLAALQAGQCAAEPNDATAAASLVAAGALIQTDADGFVREVRFPAAPANTATASNLQLLADLPRVRSVVLAGSGTTDAELEIISQIGTLRNLDLRECPLTNAALSHAALLSNLEALRFSGKSGATTIDDAGMQQIAKLKKLRVLMLDYLWVSEVGIAKLVGLEQLEELTLAQTLINDDCMVLIARFPQLRKLRLARTGISASGLSQIVAMHRLEDLDLSEAAQISDKALAHVGRMRELKRLNLWRVPVGDAGASQLAGLANLEWLNLDNTTIGDKGLAVVGGLKKLTFLHLGSTAVSDAGLASLAELTALKELVLTRTAVSAAAAAQLAKQLPQAQIRLDFVAGQ